MTSDEVFERYEREAPAPPQGVAVPGAFGYIHFKAFRFLLVGPSEYRETDALHLPPAHWPELTLEAVTHGCEQLVQWCGLSSDRPLEGIGVSGFYALLRVFHFEVASHQATESEPGMILDVMHMRHGIESTEITLYNRVRSPGLQKTPGPPCPYCAEPLRTSKAKQCRACGRDWHDPANVRRREET